MVKQLSNVKGVNFVLVFLSFCHAIISVFLLQGVDSAQNRRIKYKLNTIEAFND